MTKTERKKKVFIDLHFKATFNDFLNYNWFQYFIVLKIIKKGELILSSGNTLKIEIINEIISCYASQELSEKDKAEYDIIRYKICDIVL